jgi:hypothetical protein
VADDPFLERPLAGCSEENPSRVASLSVELITKRASYLERRLVRNAALADRAPWQWRQPDSERPGPRRGRTRAVASRCPQAEAGFVESALSFPDRAPGSEPGSERAIVADIEWRSTDLGPVLEFLVPS